MERESISYKIGYILGYGIVRLVKSFIILVWKGVFIASRYCEVFATIYFILFGLTIALYILSLNCLFALIPFLIISISGGIWVEIKEYPYKQLVRYFNKGLEEVGIKEINDDYTKYLLRISNTYATEYYFQTLTPLNVWQSKKSALEMYLGKKIIEIRDNEPSVRDICILVKEDNLPSMLEWDDKYLEFENDFILGESYWLKARINLQKTPHYFICGTTGCGKSNLMKCLIYQGIKKDYKVILIDFKRGVSFSNFSNFVSIYYEYASATNILESMVEETRKRLDLFRENKVDNLDDYNRKTDYKLQQVLIFIDELAELLKTRDKEISNRLYDSIETLTRLSRSAGIHLIMGIQRPDSTVVNGQIKNNVGGRICGRFVDKEPARIVGCEEACGLPDIKGRFIIKDTTTQIFQSYYYTDKDYPIESIKGTDNTIADELPEDILPEQIQNVANKDKIEKSTTIEFDFTDIYGQEESP